VTEETGSVIPDKAYFRIGEVAEIVGVKPYVVRYWETEFKQLRPDKSRTNQRVYSRADVQLLLTIKTLLYTDGFTIDGARKQLQLSGRGRSQGGPMLPFPEAGEGDPAAAGDQDVQPPPVPEPVLATTQMKSFLSELDDSKSELSRLRRKADDAEARVSELESKLTEERRARGQLSDWVRREIADTLRLVEEAESPPPPDRVTSA